MTHFTLVYSEHKTRENMVFFPLLFIFTSSPAGIAAIKFSGYFIQKENSMTISLKFVNSSSGLSLASKRLNAKL